MRVVNRLAELVAQKERREGRKITQTDIANETGLAYNTVSDWMNNSVTAYKGDTLLTLCAWIPCSPGDLLVIEDVPSVESDMPGNQAGRQSRIAAHLVAVTP